MAPVRNTMARALNRRSTYESASSTVAITVAPTGQLGGPSTCREGAFADSAPRQAHHEFRRAIDRLGVEPAGFREHDLLWRCKGQDRGFRLPTFVGLGTRRNGSKMNGRTSAGIGSSLVHDLDDDFGTIGARLDDDGRSRRGVLDGIPAMLERTSARRSGSQSPVTSPSTSSWIAGVEFLGNDAAYVTQIGGLRFDSGTLPEASAGPHRVTGTISPPHAFAASDDDTGLPLQSSLVELAVQQLPFDCHADRPERITQVVAHDADEHFPDLGDRTQDFSLARFCALPALTLPPQSVLAPESSR